ncbi:MAG: aspartate aminotransferase family protein [Bacteroidetes bacterium]|nr:MAG: aspartate aminotransferase family protein [Bacteroidota bacterium]
MTQRHYFLQHVAQTSKAPIAIEIARAEGCRLWDVNGKSYLDLIAGISVANTGHRHPKILAAIEKQLQNYMHVMVYGELIESPQVHYARALVQNLPSNLNSVYFTNSGAEAVEGAMKLAKRFTGRTNIASFDKSYHGSTQGALSLMGDEYWRNAFRPLLPGISHLEYDSVPDLDLITPETACVVMEPVQAERGVVIPSLTWINAVQKRCKETGALLILDEIQTGFGRTGSLWAFEQLGFVPDILLLGKALGGGLPLGAFISDINIMKVLTENPVLGHITTFGGHPICCAAGLAGLELLIEEKLVDHVEEKAQIFRKLLVHPRIKSVRSKGLLIAVEFSGFEENKAIIDACIEKGVFSDWFLFAPHCLRIAPPLNISAEEISEACNVILACLS